MKNNTEFTKIDKKAFNKSLSNSIKYVQDMFSISQEDFKELFEFSDSEYFQVMSGKMGLSIFHWLNIGSYLDAIYHVSFENISMQFYELEIKFPSSSK